jgi:hypothetical protein
MTRAVAASLSVYGRAPEIRLVTVWWLIREVPSCPRTKRDRASQSWTMIGLVTP